MTNSRLADHISSTYIAELYKVVCVCMYVLFIEHSLCNLAGWLYDLTGNYDIPYMVMGCCVLVAGIIYTIVWRLQCVRHRMNKVQVVKETRQTDLSIANY